MRTNKSAPGKDTKAIQTEEMGLLRLGQTNFLLLIHFSDKLTQLSDNLPQQHR